MPFNIGNMFRPTQQIVTPPTPQAGGPAIPGGTTAPPANGSTMQIQNPGAGELNPPQTNQTQDNSPLAGFSSLWETDPNAKPPVDPWSQPILPNDPAKIQEAARKMNLMQGVDPALVQKVMAGNDPQAVMDLIQFASQSTLAMAAQLTTATVEKAGTTIRDRERAGLDERFRSFQDRNLSVDDPVLNHPAAQPMLDMARRQIRMKNPNMSADKVQEMAVQYLRQFATAMGTGDPTQQSAKLDATGTPEQDWSTFAE